MNLLDVIDRFQPRCEQEREDRRMMQSYLARFDNLLVRENEIAHFTASAWITSPARDRVLMAYHNIYRSWAWTGGHADGNANLLEVALKEAGEETAAHGLRAVAEAPISLEILPVPPHFRKGKFVVAHLHLNLTYLLEAEDKAPVRNKPDENSAVQWFPLREAVAASTEPDMRKVYEKLNGYLEAQSRPV